MIEDFGGREGEYLAWVAAHPHGFVVNAEVPPRAKYLVLHSAKCLSIHTEKRTHYTGPAYTKFAALGRSDLETWSRARFGASPRPCGICVRSGLL